MTSCHDRSRIILGSFNGEDYLRSKNLAKLPAIPDKEASRIVAAMDELLFLFCNSDDLLITRYVMNPEHVAYLQGLGFQFDYNKKDLTEEVKTDANIFHLLSEEAHLFQSKLSLKSYLEPFAVLPGIDEACTALGIKNSAPAPEVIARVNSKLYSTKLRQTLKLMDDSRIVTTSEDLQSEGEDMLKTYPEGILIKDVFGVSGRGNVLIPSVGILKRIKSHIARQEKKGMEVCFILEPFYKKEIDFSSQFYIEQDGTYSLLSVQKLVNRDFAYVGSYSADEAFHHMLEEKGYFHILRKIGEALYEEGYYGDVCVDSMILGGGVIYPIVEINPRKSMSLIKHQIDEYLKIDGLQHLFAYLGFRSSRDISYKALQGYMREKGLLYEKGCRQGIIPLTANTLTINKSYDANGQIKKAYKGRLYIAVVGEQMASIWQLHEQMKELCTQLDLAIG